MSTDDTTQPPQAQVRLLVNQHGLISGVRFTKQTPDVVFGDPEVVRIKPSGEVVIAEGANLDDAALAFWHAITEWRSTASRPTLADAQPGGRVRLPDQAERARFEAWPHAREFEIQKDGSGEYLSEVTQGAWLAWKYLSAQPSQGGQGDLKSRFTEWVKANSYNPATFASGRFIGDGVQIAWEAVQALAARQPVGEPVAYTSETQFKAVRVCGDGIMSQRNTKWDIPLYLQPEQAVDLPYSLDADPAGIRARVADVITGTLMVGAQGHMPPPTGHWADPFWQAARADATAQAVDLGQEHVATLTVDDDGMLGWKLTHIGRDLPEGEYRLALIDSQAVGNG